MGFQEACDNAVLVRIQSEPPIDIPVATPAGMTVLKIMSWADCSADIRPKDAKGLGCLLSTYENIPCVRNQLFESESIMERYDWDIRLAGAHKLGMGSASIAATRTCEEIVKILTERQDRLVQEMCEHIDSDCSAEQYDDRGICKRLSKSIKNLALPAASIIAVILGFLSNAIEGGC